MKKYFEYYKNRFIFLIFIYISIALQAQTQPDTIIVASDVPPSEGNLNIAIQNVINKGTLSKTIFKLEPNGYYILTGIVTVPEGQHLTIVAPEPGTTQETAPPQIIWTSSSGVNQQYNFHCFGDITLKNVWLMYANTSGEQVGSSLCIEDNSNPNGQRAEFEGVIFDYSPCPQNASGAVGIASKHFKGIFKNCYFKNCIDRHLRYYGRALSFPFNTTGWHSDSVLFENCTFANIGYVYMQEEDEYSDYVKFNHCTFLNVVMYSLESGWWNKLAVTNCIFVNCHMYGDMPAYRYGSSAPYNEPYGGTIRIDSISNFEFPVPFSEQDRRILFSNSNYFIEKWLSDWFYNNPYSVYVRKYNRADEAPVPQPMLSPGTLRFFDAYENGQKVFPFMNRANLYDSTDPGFILAPTDTIGIKGFLYRKWDNSEDTLWGYFPELSIQRLWPIKENLAYTNPTLLTAGMGGFPLGDLYRWFPDKYTQWKAKEESENTRISFWLNTGIDPIVTVMNETSGNKIPSNFILKQNYPNPFNAITQINYSVPQQSFISLKVYNLLGQEVAILFEGVQQVGNHNATFDGAGLASGIYFYKLQSDEFIDIKKLMLLR